MVEVVSGGVDPSSLMACDIMSEDIVTMDESSNLLDTLDCMREKGIRRLPITNSAGLLVGIIALDDILELVGEQLDSIVRLVRNEQRREQQTRE